MKAIPLAGLTANQSLKHCLKVGEGDIVLIHAAASGVGSFAVQIAVAQGAPVGPEHTVERLEPRSGWCPLPGHRQLNESSGRSECLFNFPFCFPRFEPTPDHDLRQQLVGKQCFRVGPLRKRHEAVRPAGWRTRSEKTLL